MYIFVVKLFQFSSEAGGVRNRFNQIIVKEIEMKGPTKEDLESRTHLTKNMTILKDINKYQRHVLQVTGASSSLKASVAARVLHAIASVIGGPSREHQCRLVLLFSDLAVMKSICDRSVSQRYVAARVDRTSLILTKMAADPQSPICGKGLTREPRRQQPNRGIGCFPSSV